MSGRKPTPQQARALAARCSPVTLAAGAGCGKTTVLVRRFLDQLDPEVGGSPLAKVVAITFTRAAAAEMRHRLRLGCEERLAAATGPAAEHWLSLIRELDGARVGTIHGFCGRLLRSHAVEADVDPAFGEIEPGAALRLRRDATARYLRDGLLAKDADCERFVGWYGYADGVEKLVKLAAGRDGGGVELPDRLEDAAEDQVEPLLESWAAAVADGHVARRRELLTGFASGPEIGRVARLLRDAEPTGKGATRRSEVLAATDPERLAAWPDYDDETVAADLDRIRKAAKVQGGGTAKDWGEAFEPVKAAFATLRDAAKALAGRLDTADGGDDTTRLAAEVSLCAARLTAAVDREYGRTLKAAAAVPIDALVTRAASLLAENDSVRRRVAAGIDLLMVDEFQDTDPKQADLVELIGKADVARRPKLFVVGDRQQSIYRFRKADPTVFERFRETAPPEGRLELSENFRSRGEILRFVNHAFDGEALPLSAGTESPPLDDRDVSTPIELVLPAVEGKAEERREAGAAATVARLAEFFDDEIPRVRTRDEAGNVSLRKIEHGDVCILAPTHAAFGPYERALEAAGIPHFVDGGKAFYTQQEVLDVAMLCGWLTDAGDTASLTGLLRSPMFGFDDETLLALRVEGGSVPTGLFGSDVPAPLNDGQADRVVAAREILTELRARKDDLPAEALLRLAFERTGYDASLLFEAGGRRKTANLAKLLDVAAEADARETAPLAALAATLRDAVLDEPAESLAAVQAGRGAVTLMTVHKAKGLEFPVVVVADIDREPRGFRDQVAWSRTLGPLLKLPPDEVDGDGKHAAWDLHVGQEHAGDEAEARRLLYVAATRAEDRLILSGTVAVDADGVEKASKSPWLKLLRERFDLREGTPREAAGDVPSLHLVGETKSRTSSSKTAGTKLDLADLASMIESAEPIGPGYLPDLPTVRRDFSVTEIAERLASGAGTAGPRSDASEYGRKAGIAVHAAFERFPEDAAEIAEWASAGAEAAVDLPASRREELRDLLEVFAASPVAGEIRKPNAAREADLFLPWSDDDRGPVIYGRVDAVTRPADRHWHVIDYKVPVADYDSGDDLDALIGRYAGQLAIYAIGLRSAVLGKPVADAIGDESVTVTAELVVLGGTVRRVPVDVGPTALRGWLPRIDQALATAATNDE